MLKIWIPLLKGQNKLSTKKWPLVSLTGTTKVEELIIGQCVPYPITSTPMLIEYNQETIDQEEGEASSMASTNNRPASIAALNDTSEGMSPHQRDHPMRATTTSFLMDFQMDGILRGLQALLPHCPLRYRAGLSFYSQLMLNSFFPFLSLLFLFPFIRITFLFLLLYYHHFPSFYFSSHDSHQATGRRDCYCALERGPTTPTADVKDRLHSQRPPYLVPQNQDSLPCPLPPPPIPKPWRPSHPNGH